jgi:hypothetical protein
MTIGFQSKNSLSSSATKLENFSAPSSPRNKAPTLAISMIKPLENPLIKPKLRAMDSMISITFTSANVLYFWESPSKIKPKASIFECAKKST